MRDQIDGRELNETLADCQRGGGSSGFDAEFGQNAGDVVGDRFRTHEELRRDVAIGFSVDKQAEHLRFAGR